jgi:hypothetical protein
VIRRRKLPVAFEIFIGDWKQPQILNTPQIRWLDARCVKRLAIIRRASIGILQMVLQALEL